MAGIAAGLVLGILLVSSSRDVSSEGEMTEADLGVFFCFFLGFFFIGGDDVADGCSASMDPLGLSGRLSSGCDVLAEVAGGCSAATETLRESRSDCNALDDVAGGCSAATETARRSRSDCNALDDVADGFLKSVEIVGGTGPDCDARDNVRALILRTISFRSSVGGSTPAS